MKCILSFEMEGPEAQTYVAARHPAMGKVVALEPARAMFGKGSQVESGPDSFPSFLCVVDRAKTAETSPFTTSRTGKDLDRLALDQ